MPTVNLVPRDHLEARQVRRRMWLWIVVASCCWLLTGIPILGDQFAAGELAARSQRMQGLAGGLEVFRRQCRTCDQRLVRLQHIVSRAVDLGSKRPWSAAIGTVVGVMPEGVWLERVATDPVRPVPPPPAPTGDVAREPPPLVRQSPPRRLVIEGHAVGIEDVYRYMTALTGLGLFEQARLERVDEAALQGRRVTRFIMICEW